MKTVAQLYGELKPINEGAYGTVYRASKLLDGSCIALKTLYLRYYPVKQGKNEEKLLLATSSSKLPHKVVESRSGVTQVALREIRILKQISNGNAPKSLIKLFNISVGSKDPAAFESQTLYLEFEFCQHDLGTLVDNVKCPFTISHIKGIFVQLSEAVEYLHKNHILHRDIKLENVLYNSRGEVKLCDFGFARFHSDKFSFHRAYTTVIGTLWYRAPEILLRCSKYGFAVDIWAMGCILGELLFQAPMFPGKTESEQLLLLFKAFGIPSKACWSEFSDLLSSLELEGKESVLQYVYQNNTSQEDELGNAFQTRMKDFGDNGKELLFECLTFDPSKRISAQELKQHPYLKKSTPYPSNLLPTFPSSFKSVHE